MIHLIPTEAKRFRTFGWVQDPSDFRSLCDVVAIFDETSLKHQELAGQVIPALVEERDGRQRLLDALNQRPLRISYTDLVGTSFTPRSAARCNGIVQAAVEGRCAPLSATGRRIILSAGHMRWAFCAMDIRAMPSSSPRQEKPWLRQEHRERS